MCHPVLELPRPPPPTPSQLGPARYPPADNSTDSTPHNNTSHGHNQPPMVVCPVPRNGLQNLGNTCYLNAAIQMLRSIPSLQRALQPFRQVPLVTQYLDVLAQLDQPGPHTVRPDQLKTAIAHHCSYFNNDEQHDAHELLEVLLNALDKQLLSHCTLGTAPATQPHTHTNTAINESDRAESWWTDHVRSVHPLMANLLHGQLSNWTQCPNCPSPVTSYEPFTMLSLPVTVDNQPNTEVDRIMVCVVCERLTSPIDWHLTNLRVSNPLIFTTQFLFQKIQVEDQPFELMLIESGQMSMRMLPSTEVIPKEDGCFLLVFSLPPIVTTNMDTDTDIQAQSETLLFIITQSQSDQSGEAQPLPVWPILFRLGVGFLDLLKDLVRELMKKVHSIESLNRSHLDYVLRRWSSGSLLRASHPIQYKRMTRHDRHHPQRLIHPTDRSPNSQDRIVMLNVLWQPGASQRYELNLDLPQLDYKQPELFMDFGETAAEQMTDCSIEDCLRALFKPDLVTGDNAWACPDCAPEKVEATRWSQLRRAPQHLILHLKRFNNNNQKLMANVTYPIDDLNVGEFTGVQTDKYKLQAVICHLGNDLANGHYVCVARDPLTPQHFNLHDDGRVELDCDPHRPSDVYLLLYQRTNQHDTLHTDTQTPSITPYQP